jgi:hypothetical protein
MFRLTPIIGRVDSVLFVPLRSIDGPQAGHLGKPLAGVLEAADPDAGRAHRLRQKERFIVVFDEVLKQDDLV